MRFIRPVAVTEANLVSSSVPETLPEYDVAATYAQGDRVRSATQVYESLIDGNTGNALTVGTAWIKVGPTNRFAAFDDVNSTITTGEDITFTVRPGELIDSVALLDVSATSATVIATSDLRGEVYNRTFKLSTVKVEPSFWAWFFEPIKRSSVLVVTDIPLVADLTITISLQGQNQSLATFAMGTVWTLGETEMGARVGITDYSRKETSQFGDQILVERAYSKRGNFTVWCTDGQADENAMMLAKYRAKNLVWIGSDKYASTVIYGWSKNWECEIAYPTKSIFSLELEGLT